MTFRFSHTGAEIFTALASKQASGIACFAQTKDDSAWLYSGHTSKPETKIIPTEITKEAIWDLASLTKIFSTTNLVYQAILEKKLSLDHFVSEFFPQFPFQDIQIKHLLNHNAGLAWHLPFFEYYKKQPEQMGNQSAVLQWICESDRKAELRKETVYSDLDFLLLGFILEQIFQMPIVEAFYQKIALPLGLKNCGFRQLPHSKTESRGFLTQEATKFVATETCPWRKKTLQGEVHDDNTWAMGGYAGHAGLFSNLEDAKVLLDALIDIAQQLPFLVPFPSAPKQFQFHFGFMFFPGLKVNAETQWNSAIGHTGYTGTSAWYHPASQRKMILLSNRVHPSREDTRWIQSRLAIHRTFWEETR